MRRPKHQPVWLGLVFLAPQKFAWERCHVQEWLQRPPEAGQWLAGTLTRLQGEHRAGIDTWDVATACLGPHGDGPLAYQRTLVFRLGVRSGLGERGTSRRLVILEPRQA